MSPNAIDGVTGTIVDAAYKIHSKLGPGLLETVYETVLARDLSRRGLSVERQAPISFEYDGLRFENGFRADLLVAGCVIVEIKSVEKLGAVHPKQLLSYLRLARLRVGLLINFGEAHLRDGLKRIVNGLPEREAQPLRISQASEL